MSRAEKCTNIRIIGSMLGLSDSVVARGTPVALPDCQAYGVRRLFSQVQNAHALSFLYVS
jgi:hypothetical protein